MTKAFFKLLIVTFTILIWAQVQGDTSHPQVWQPQLNQTFQVILKGILDISQGIMPPFDIFDLDLFYHNSSTFQVLHEHGKKVICYYSAGSAEDWRPDWAMFRNEDKGNCLGGWSGERWLDIRKASVWNVMKARIKLASEKGCDAIDPDNIDAFSNENGLNLTAEDAIKYVKQIAVEAAKYSMSTGLKNAESILSDVKDSVQFVVNESCVSSPGNCTQYIDFGKPIYHIEYVQSYNVTSDDFDRFCLRSNDTAKGLVSSAFNTLIKTLDLDGWVTFCDGKSVTSPILPDGVKKGLKECLTGSPKLADLLSLLNPSKTTSVSKISATTTSMPIEIAESRITDHPSGNADPEEQIVYAGQSSLHNKDADS